MEFISDVLYSLKRQYPTPVDVYVNTSTSTDLASGKKVSQRQKWHVAKAIKLPETLLRNFLIMLERRGFTTGAFKEIGNEVLIIDRKDIKIEITMEHFIVIDKKRFDITSIEKIIKKAYVMTIKETLDAPSTLILEETVEQDLNLVDSASGTL